MSIFARLRRAMDPRRSIGARLLFGFSLAFLIPGAVFVLLLSRKLSGLQQQSLERLAGVRLAQTSAQMREDASFRAISMDRRVAVVTEAVWALADSARLALAGKIEIPDRAIERDEHGHVWTPAPEDETIAFIAASRSDSAEARRDFTRSRALGPLFARLRERHPSIRSVSLWTASGVMRLSPWTDLHEAIRQSGGALESFTFNKTARFPESRPPGGDEAVWTAAYGQPRLMGEARLVSLFVPVRDDGGRLSAGISVGVDARQYVMEALDAGSLPGDLWFATDSLGHAVLAGDEAARLLRWNTEGPETLASSSSAERGRLARTILSSPRSEGDYALGGRVSRLASARVLSTGWVFVEGLSADALAKIAAGAAQEIAPKSYSEFRRYLVLAFLYLLVAMLAAVFLVTRRFTAPIADLVQAAEEIGRGRPVAFSRPPGQDELGRLAIALNRTGRRVERRVETLRRLHSLLRQEYRAAELPEIIARSTEAIAAFTRAERVWFFLHDPNTNRLQAAWPGWNLSEEAAAKLQVPIGSRSTASQPPEGPFPAERQSRAAHAADLDRGLDGPARGANRQRNDAAARVEAGAPIGPRPAGPDRRPARPGADGPRDAFPRPVGCFPRRRGEPVDRDRAAHGGGERRRADPRPAAGVDAGGARRPFAPPAGPLEPARQRHQVHAAPRAGHRPPGTGARTLSRQRRGRRHRHPGKRAAPRLRALPPGGRIPDPPAFRNGNRSRSRPVPRRVARRDDLGRQPAGAWQPIHVQPADSADGQESRGEGIRVG